MMIVVSTALAMILCLSDSSAIVPLRADDMLELQSFSGDTLYFNSNADEIFKPFGAIETTSDIGHSSLGRFSIDTLQRGAFRFHRLVSGSSYAILFLNHEPGEERSSYVVKGSILDSTVVMKSGVRVGMTINDFFATLFAKIPPRWTKARTLVFQSYLMSDMQTYTITNGRISRIQFDCVDCVEAFQF